MHYILTSPDGRMVTNDTRTGAKLTMSNAICYTWESEDAAEVDRPMYQAILGVLLVVKLRETRSGFLI